MKKGDIQLGAPFVNYSGTTVELDALTGVPAGAQAWDETLEHIVEYDGVGWSPIGGSSFDLAAGIHAGTPSAISPDDELPFWKDVDSSLGKALYSDFLDDVVAAMFAFFDLAIQINAATLSGGITGSDLIPYRDSATGDAYAINFADLIIALDYISSSYLDTDGTLAANSDAKIATQKATKTYVDNAVTGLLDFKGSTNCSANPNYPAASKGDAYIVSVAGKIGGASGKSVDVSDVYVASADNAGGSEASVGTSWFVLEHNLVGALLSANNLSDLTNSGTALDNLGLSNNGKNLVTTTNYASMRGLLSLVVGTNVQVQSAELDTLITYTAASVSGGWRPVTYTINWSSSDDPVYQVFVGGDQSANEDFKPGNRIKFTNNSSTFYGIIVKRGAYDSGNARTPVDLYGGTDYDVANSAITAVYISKIKSPDGFPMNPDKWTVSTVTSDSPTKSSPTASTWYGGTGLSPTGPSIDIPIGAWRVFYKAIVDVSITTAGVTSVGSRITLSTANNSESDVELSEGVSVSLPIGTGVVQRSAYTAEKIIAVTSKTTYYLNIFTGTASVTSILLNPSAVFRNIIKAVCAYL